jgi:hypothetical protein
MAAIDGSFIMLGVMLVQLWVPGTLSAPGSSGTLTWNVLTKYQGKDVGIVVQYWIAVGSGV